MQEPLRRPWTEPGRDPELAHAAQHGDLAEMFTLLREYRRELWRICFALTLDHRRAERLFHETLLRAARNLRSLPNGAAFLPWLVRLATNIAFTTARQGPGASQGAVTLAPDSIGTELSESEARALDAFAGMIESDRMLLALVAVEQLPYPVLAAVSRREITTLMHELAMLRVRLAGEDAA